MRTRLAALLGALAAAGCVPATQPPPPRPAAPASAPAAAPTSIIEPSAADWRDTPPTPGGWTYRADAGGSAAAFGRPGAAADFVLRCVGGERRVTLTRTGAPAGTMTVTTSYGVSIWPAAAGAGGAVVTLAATDPALDRIAFSRGRFGVAMPGTPALVLPAWAEPARVIEDCRG